MNERVDNTEKASEFLMGMLERMGVAADIDVTETEDRTTLEIQTQQAEVVIGRRGSVIDSLQHLVNRVIYSDRTAERGKPIIVDAGGYRAKQVERLKELAKKTAERVLETQALVELQPMSAYDRRIVHMEISMIPGLTTRSEGEGEDRHICVFPASAA